MKKLIFSIFLISSCNVISADLARNTGQVAKLAWGGTKILSATVLAGAVAKSVNNIMSRKLPYIKPVLSLTTVCLGVTLTSGCSDIKEAYQDWKAARNAVLQK